VTNPTKPTKSTKPTRVTKRIGLIINPTSDKGRGAAVGHEVAARLVAQGHHVVDLSAESAGGARERAAIGIASGLDVLAVSGGDGTVNLGVNLCAGTETVLAIVAAGTGNDVARALHLPVHDALGSAGVIDAGTVRTIDAGRHTDDRGASHWFAGVLGAGFDSLVNERARELPLFRAVPYVIEVDGVRYATRAMLVAVANGPSYGGGMMVCPDARLDDGLFDILVVNRISTVEFLKVFPKVFSGRHVGHPAVQILRGRQVRLEASGIIGYADGERFAPLPMSVQIVPDALHVLVPGPAVT